MNYKKKYNKYKLKYLKLKKILGGSELDEDLKRLVETNLIAIQPTNGNLTERQIYWLNVIEYILKPDMFKLNIELFKHHNNITNIEASHVNKFIDETLQQLNQRFTVIETLYKYNPEKLNSILESISDDDHPFEKLQELYKEAINELQKRQHVGYKGE
tara:strand:+ start:1064 stop:1537 length:474 start_codon:yes stop_codon:yes gene_type:complete